MKTIQLLILAILMISISACKTEVIGPPGPQGPEGPAGAQGESAFVFEYTNVDLNVANNFEAFLDYPAGFTGLESDVTLVYLLWEITTDTNGNDLEIWRQVPQTVFTANGILNYNFDFSTIDLHLFLALDFDPVLLEPIDTDDWIVRAVVIPGDFFGARTSVDHSNYNDVKAAYGLPELTKHKIAKRRL